MQNIESSYFTIKLHFLSCLRPPGGATLLQFFRQILSFILNVKNQMWIENCQSLRHQRVGKFTSLDTLLYCRLPKNFATIWTSKWNYTNFVKFTPKMILEYQMSISWAHSKLKKPIKIILWDPVISKLVFTFCLDWPYSMLPTQLC